jgi:hypothetical protein
MFVLDTTTIELMVRISNGDISTFYPGPGDETKIISKLLILSLYLSVFISSAVSVDLAPLESDPDPR